MSPVTCSLTTLKWKPPNNARQNKRVVFSSQVLSVARRRRILVQSRYVTGPYGRLDIFCALQAEMSLLLSRHKNKSLLKGDTSSADIERFFWPVPKASLIGYPITTAVPGRGPHTNAESVSFLLVPGRITSVCSGKLLRVWWV